MNDEFYIGYEPTMPDRMAVRVRAASAVLLSIAVLLSAVLVLAQRRFADSTFEFGRTRHFEGMLIEYPYPALLVTEHVRDDVHVRPDIYWLVGPGKHGASDIVRGRDGRVVRLSGSLIERDADRMIEVSSIDPPIENKSSDATPVAPMRSMGAIVVRGEIVDSKCHLGVMKPGEGPTHRDCAVRCLLGRITPMFVPHGDQVGVGRLALVDRDGGPITEPLAGVVGRPVEVRGELLARGPMRFLAMRSIDATAGLKTRLYENGYENGASFLNVASTQR